MCLTHTARSHSTPKSSSATNLSHSWRCTILHDFAFAGTPLSTRACTHTWKRTRSTSSTTCSTSQARPTSLHRPTQCLALPYHAATRRACKYLGKLGLPIVECIFLSEYCCRRLHAEPSDAGDATARPIRCGESKHVRPMRHCAAAACRTRGLLLTLERDRNAALLLGAAQSVFRSRMRGRFRSGT
jgi:hypothetical protein